MKRNRRLAAAARCRCGHWPAAKPRERATIAIPVMCECGQVGVVGGSVSEWAWLGECKRVDVARWV
jgi:hypothetical protein